jgi:hypothetical protein
MKQFTSFLKISLLIIVFLVSVVAGTHPATAAGDLKKTGVSSGPGGLYVYAEFNRLPTSNKKYIFRVATATTDASAVLVSGEIGARNISTSVGNKIIATSTWPQTGTSVAGLTLGTQYYLLITEKNTTTAAETRLAEHQFKYESVMASDWTEPATTGGGTSSGGSGTGSGTLTDTTFAVTATILASGNAATVTMSIVDNDQTVPVIVEYGGSINLSSGQSETKNLPPNSSTAYEILGLEPLTTYFFAIRSATAVGTYYVQRTAFTTAASGAGYDLSAGGETPICTDGSDGYCLLAPIGGITVIKDADLENYFGTIYKILIAAAGVLALLMIFWGGVQYMTVDSLLDKSLGKARIQNAVFGLIIALSSYAILNTVNPKLLNFTFGVDKLEISFSPEDIDAAIPQSLGPDGKFCGLYTDGEAWEDDAAERTQLLNLGATVSTPICTTTGQTNCIPSTDVKVPTCTVVGQGGCTSVKGLRITGGIAKLRSLCPTCELTITGGTECWLHSSGTAHGKNSPAVDLRNTGTPILRRFVEAPGNSKGQLGTWGRLYVVNGIEVVDEGDHYHIWGWNGEHSDLYPR